MRVWGRRVAAAAATLVIGLAWARALAAPSTAGAIDPRYKAIEELIKSFQTDSPLITEAGHDVPQPPPPVDAIHGGNIAPEETPFPEHQATGWGHLRVKGDAVSKFGTALVERECSKSGTPCSPNLVCRRALVRKG